MNDGDATNAVTPDGTVAEAIESRALAIPELRVFRTRLNADARGWVAPTYNAALFAELGIHFTIAHENHCYSPRRGTVRGFHYQLPPYGQAKLIRVIRGRIYDANIDIRRGSPTFGQAVTVELAAGDWDQIFVPVGFAHCYLTLEQNTEVFFKLGCSYAPGHARGFAWNDPSFSISWPVPKNQIIALPRDLEYPSFLETKDFFSHPTK